MHITKRKKQAIKNIVAALLSLLLLFSALRLIPALLRALPDSGADYLPGVLNGALRDGISLWVPTFLTDRSGLETAVAVLMTAFMPVFCRIGYAIS